MSGAVVVIGQRQPRDGAEAALMLIGYALGLVVLVGWYWWHKRHRA